MNNIVHVCQSSYGGFVALQERAEALEGVVKALQSVLSEEGVREFLGTYVMGIELLDRLESLDD